MSTPERRALVNILHQKRAPVNILLHCEMEVDKGREEVKNLVAEGQLPLCVDRKIDYLVEKIFMIGIIGKFVYPYSQFTSDRNKVIR